MTVAKPRPIPYLFVQNFIEVFSLKTRLNGTKEKNFLIVLPLAFASTNFVQEAKYQLLSRILGNRLI